MRSQSGFLNDDDRLKRLSDLGSTGLVMDVEMPQATASMRATATVSRDVPAAPAEALEQVLKFLTSPDDRVTSTEEGEEGAPPKRDMRAALELAVKVFEAVRAADERVVAADEFQRQLTETHDQQIRAIETRIAASEKRLKSAEGRAKDAETWLAKFHDNIVEDFQRTFAAR